VLQQIRATDRIRPRGRPGHQAPDLQVRVDAALAARPDVPGDQIRQPGALRQRHHRNKAESDTRFGSSKDAPVRAGRHNNRT
jgi:hypothetical protein